MNRTRQIRNLDFRAKTLRLRCLVRAALASSRILLAAYGFLSASPSSGQTNAEFALHDGDRVALYGDSITEQRKYSAEVEMYTVTRFPKADIRFHGLGVGGDKVSGGYMGPVDLRIDRDLLAWKPTVITIMLGMNDGYYRANEEGIFRTYTEGMEHILKRLHDELPAARVNLLAPSPFDDVTRDPQFPGGYNGVMVKYGDYVKRVSSKQGLGFADLNAPVVDLLQKTQADSPDLALMLIPDRVHPAEGPTWVMAEAVLKSWNAPSIVSSVSLDARNGKVGAARNASVSDVRAGKETLTWNELEEALPLPFYSDAADPVVAAVRGHSDLVAALDQETLTVGGLQGSFQLLIDGLPVTTFTAAQLATGVNLALLETPMLQQARLVGADTDKRNNLEQAYFSASALSLAAETAPHTLAIAALQEKARIQQRLDAQPKPHHFELRYLESSK